MSEGINGLTDFVGYPVGQGVPSSTPGTPSAGLYGLTDFVGYSVGQGIPGAVPGIPFAGLYGLVDFVGYPIGQGLGGAVTGRGPKVGGKFVHRLLIGYMLEERRRDDSILKQRKIEQAFKLRAEQAAEIARRQRLLTTIATYSTLFAEL